MYRVFLLLFLIPSLTFAEWSQFKGPNNNDTIAGDGLFKADLKQWKKAWEINIGNGYSAASVIGNLAYCMGHDRLNTETLYCLDVKNGKTLWKYQYEGILLDKQHTGGPNATPTIEGDKIYILGKAGQTFCLNRQDGTLIWQADIKALSKVKMPNWGYASSPIIHKDKLIFSCGKTIVLDKNTGKLLWVSKNVEKEERSYISGYATPVVFTFKGSEYVTFYLGSGLEILKLNDGTRAARYNLKSKYNMVGSTPVVTADGSQIVLAWNPYSALLNFDGKSLKAVWKNKEATRSFQNAIVKDGIVFGTHGHFRDKRTKLHALDIKTGKALWEEKFQWSQIIAIGDTLLCQNIDGHLTTVDISGNQFKEVSSLKVLDNICWTKPTYSQGRIFVRNNLGRLICYQVKP